MALRRALRAAPRGAALTSFGRGTYAGRTGGPDTGPGLQQESASAVDTLSAIAAVLAAVSEAASAIDISADASGGSGDVPSANPLPGGALSFTVTWDAVAGAAGYVIAVSTSTVQYPDKSLYTYFYLASAGATSLVISGVAAGTKYVRVAAHQSGYVGDLSHEVTYTPA